MGEREIVWWGLPYQEQLVHESADELIEATLDEMHPDVPVTIEICGYARMEIDPATLNPLERILEVLDEEFGDPDGGDYTKPTPAMVEAEKAFCAVIAREYVSYACDVVVKKVVDIREWRKARGEK